MTLADISIKRPVFAWMIFWALIIFGAICFTRLGISQMPDVDFPVVNVSLSMNGASPEVMETNIVDIVEDNLLSVEDVDAAVQEVQTRVAQAQRLLPASLDPPVITKTNPEDTPILWISVTGEGNTRDLMVFVRDIIKNQFSVVPGVGQIFLGGFTDRNLRIWLDGNKMKNLELAVEDIQNAIKREHIEEPAGVIESIYTM
jgi:multidrug efflux pump subunit AcrB